VTQRIPLSPHQYPQAGLRYAEMVKMIGFRARFVLPPLTTEGAFYARRRTLLRDGYLHH
jgi:hypothetical protein